MLKFVNKYCYIIGKIEKKPLSKSTNIIIINEKETIPSFKSTKIKIKKEETEKIIEEEKRKRLNSEYQELTRKMSSQHSETTSKMFKTSKN